MSNDNSLSRPELDDRIAILQDNLRQSNWWNRRQDAPVARPRNGTPTASLNSANNSID